MIDRKGRKVRVSQQVKPAVDLFHQATNSIKMIVLQSEPNGSRIYP